MVLQSTDKLFHGTRNIWQKNIVQNNLLDSLSISPWYSFRGLDCKFRHAKYHLLNEFTQNSWYSHIAWGEYLLNIYCTNNPLHTSNSFGKLFDINVSILSKLRNSDWVKIWYNSQPAHVAYFNLSSFLIICPSCPICG